ncbi:hypothetical protein HYX13_02050, partial [Candidatus Woesearchaeota archaeon]|nr:hypothetical protein [Candidatus Woesearchaeota archaeon]
MGSIIPDKFTWVADELSSLSISVKNGDSITVTSRELEGKIPLVKHIFQKGSLDIITGRDLIVSVTERQIKISPPPPYPQDKEISLENSAAFELQSVSGGKDLATTVVTSSNRYAVLSNEKKITENAIGLRVSRGLAENQMKTIDDLQAKYPAIQFALRDFDQDITVEKERLKGLIEQFGETGVYAENSRDLIAKNIKQIEIERINEISANMAQIVDEWITKNPSKVEPIKMIKFDGRFNAYHSQDRKTGEDEHFLFGERAFDPATLQDRPIRGNNPLQIIDHEYAHMQDSHLYVQEYSLLRSSGINYEEYVREKLDSLYSDVLYEGYVTLGKDHEFREFILDLRVKLAIYGDLSSSKEGELTPELASEIVEFQKKEFERMYHQSFESLDLNQEEYQQLDPQKIDKAYQLLDLWIRRLNADTAEKRFDKEGIGNIAMVDAVLKEAARVYPPLQKEYRQFVRFVEESTGGLPAYAFRNYAKTKEESFYGIRSIRFLGEDFQEAASTSTEIDRDEARRAINQGKKFVREVTQLNYDTGKISRDEYEYRMGNYCKNNACGKCLAYTLTCEPETAVVNSE